MSNVKLISISKPVGELENLSSQEMVAYVARVSNPENQLNHETSSKLLNYCIKHKHWSIFEHCFITLEIKTSRAIAAQLLRHRSFVFQEFSQRYAESSNFIVYPARKQDSKNRQNSTDDVNEDDAIWFKNIQNDLGNQTLHIYKEGLKRGIAKEQMRFLLPLSTETTLFMSGSLRSWIHYIELRCSKETQLEHRLIAEECKTIIKKQIPDVSIALGWL